MTVPHLDPYTVWRLFLKGYTFTEIAHCYDTSPSIVAALVGRMGDTEYLYFREVA